MFSRLIAPARPVLLFFIAGLVLLGIARLGLALWQFEAVSQADGWAAVLLQGLRVDVATLCLLFGLLAVALLLLPAHRLLHVVASLWLAACIALLSFLELATPGFMGEYGLRPNRLFLEYLIYPRELLSTLWHGRRLQLVLAPIIVGVVFWVGWKLARRSFARQQATASWPLRAMLALLVLCLSALGARSTLGHRPLNPAMVAFSANPLVNQLPLNSFYALATATRRWLQQEDSGMDLYGALPERGGGCGARDQRPAGKCLQRSADSHSGRACSELYRQAEEPRHRAGGKPRGAVHRPPGRHAAVAEPGPVEPERMDLHTHVCHRHAQRARHRSRGCRIFAHAGPGAWSSPKAQRISTLSRTPSRPRLRHHVLLRRRKPFRQQRGFFFGNGFGRVIDQMIFAPESPVRGESATKTFSPGQTRGFSRLHAAGKPFLGVVFSSSNHDPFEFPDGRIELYEQPKQTRNNAAKYADHAVGELFRRAMASDYWDDTVFLVVADHDSRVFGEDLVPVKNFHIPALILGGGIAPRLDERIASQIDLGPTLLSLIGIGDARR